MLRRSKNLSLIFAHFPRAIPELYGDFGSGNPCDERFRRVVENDPLDYPPLACHPGLQGGSLVSSPLLTDAGRQEAHLFCLGGKRSHSPRTPATCRRSPRRTQSGSTAPLATHHRF